MPPPQTFFLPKNIFFGYRFKEGQKIDLASEGGKGVCVRAYEGMGETHFPTISNLNSS